MFDDQPTNTNPSVPSNLPMGEPEDIFAGTAVDAEEPTPDVQPPADEPAAPPAAQPPSTALGAGVLRPKAGAPPAPPVAEQPPVESPLDSSSATGSAPMTSTENAPTMAPMPPSTGSSFERPSYSPTPPGPARPPVAEEGLDTGMIKEPIGSKKAISSIVLIVVFIVLLIGGGWIYFAIIQKPVEDPFETATPVETEEPDTVPDTTVTTPTETTDPTEEDSEESLEDTIIFGDTIPDTDGDGLDDVREEDIGTNPLNWDTDGDELSDGDEVTVWKTNPLNPDTDGDTFQDGIEVKNGYNPLGNGKLFEPPSEDEEIAVDADAEVAPVEDVAPEESVATTTSS